MRLRAPDPNIPSPGERGTSRLAARRSGFDTASHPRRACRAKIGDRGAVLIVALLLSALIAVALGSYLNLNLSSSRLARRSFNGFAALNLAETGAEEAVWSFNRAHRSDANAWSGWTTSGPAAWQKFANFDFGQNTSGWVKVYVDNIRPAASAQPKVIAQSSVGATAGVAVEKMLEVTLRRRSLFANGLVAKDAIVFAGAVTSVDSWNSDPDKDPATAAVPYSTDVRRDNGVVGSTAVASSAILVNQAHIWGYVATGGGAPQVGSRGTIRGADTPDDVAVDPRRVSTDFNADFRAVPTPTDGVILASLPRVLGTAGTKTTWRTAAINLNGLETLTVLGDVTLVLTSATGDAVNVAGNAQIIVPAGSNLTLYVAANVKIAGNGIANANAQPVSCQIYGVATGPGGQDIQIAGNGRLACVVYAPNGDVTVNGNGAVLGAVVARAIRFTGNAEFHYDEALADHDSGQPFAISKWRELTSAADRAPYAGVFEGW